jgi:hypothetical protein
VVIWRSRRPRIRVIGPVPVPTRQFTSLSGCPRSTVPVPPSSPSS